MATLKIHPFEKADLGKAPFRFVGMSEKVYCACPGAPEQPAGTCDYCGNGIRYCFHIRSADGREFVVGCDCVRRTDKESLVNATEFDRKVAEMKAAAARDRTRKRNAATDAKIKAAFDAFDADERRQAAVASMPHPVTSMAEKGYTMADYLDFMRRMAGRSGLLRVIKIIQSL